jgi:hypothetical protein
MVGTHDDDESAGGGIMLDRQKLEALLYQRFPGASNGQLAAAANALMGLKEEWEEITHADRHFLAACASVCYLVRAQGESGSELRLFQRRMSGAGGRSAPREPRHSPSDVGPHACP